MLMPTQRSHGEGDHRYEHFPGASCGEEDPPRSVERLPSSGCLIRREAFESVEMFRKDYFVGHTNYEYCAQTIGAGWRALTCPTAAEM